LKWAALFSYSFISINALVRWALILQVNHEYEFNKVIIIMTLIEAALLIILEITLV